MSRLNLIKLFESGRDLLESSKELQIKTFSNIEEQRAIESENFLSQTRKTFRGKNFCTSLFYFTVLLLGRRHL
jgi:hypothetical protein